MLGFDPLHFLMQFFPTLLALRGLLANVEAAEREVDTPFAADKSTLADD